MSEVLFRRNASVDNRLETLDHLEGCPKRRDFSIGPAKKLARVDVLSGLTGTRIR